MDATSGSTSLISSEERTDIYFRYARDILLEEGLDPIVVMEVFSGRDGLLCGMREVVEVLRRTITGAGEIWALEEGVSIKAKEVVLRIKAPYRRFGIYETAILGTLAHESGWATAAAETS